MRYQPTTSAPTDRVDQERMAAKRGLEPSRPQSSYPTRPRAGVRSLVARYGCGCSSRRPALVVLSAGLSHRPQQLAVMQRVARQRFDRIRAAIPG